MLTLPKCELCARCKDDGKHETCEAFPDGIPEDVVREPVEKECNNGMKLKKNRYHPFFGVSGIFALIFRRYYDNDQNNRS